MSPKGWFNQKVRHSMASKGIKTKTTFTRHYRGVEVKDYGFHEMLRKLKKKYPKLRFVTDTPLKVESGQNLGEKHQIEVELPMELQIKTDDELKLMTMYDLLSHEWNFYTPSGEKRVDVYEEINEFVNRHKEDLKGETK